MPVATWQATRNGVIERSEARAQALAKGTGRNACRYLASNQKRRHAERSEARAQAYRPVLQGDRQECLSLPGKQSETASCGAKRSKSTGRNACRYLPFRNSRDPRNSRNNRNIRNIRNIRNNFVASGISARENRAGRRLWSLRGETSGRKKFFLQNEPKSPFRINKEVGSLMASFGQKTTRKPYKAIHRGLCNGFQLLQPGWEIGGEGR